MWMETEGGIWARADATVFRLLMDGSRTERRMLAAERTISSAHRRVASLRRAQAMREHRESVAASRQVEREFAHTWGRLVRIRVPSAMAVGETAKPQRRAKSTALASTSTRAIRVYTTPIRDARGRIAVFFRIRYVGLKSKKWRPGLAADHALYILREEAQENGETSLEVTSILSNMGDTAEEIAACWHALEKMEEGYRSNATVQYRIIWNLPNGLDGAERRELVEDFCQRTFGRLGLPWVAAVHEPDARGDQRNYHAHICFSTRPCEHVGDHQWAIAQEKVNGLTDPDGLRRMRAVAAGHMNLACREAGVTARFTHQTHKERGIDAERQEHIGPARMAAHERGEAVAVIERNARIIESNETAVERDTTERLLALPAQVVELLRQRLELSQSRARVAKTAAIVAAVAGNARTLPRPSIKRDAIDHAALKNIAARARSLCDALLSRTNKSAGLAPSLASPRLVQAAIHDQFQAQRARQTLVDRLAIFRDRLVSVQNEKTVADFQRARKLILECAAPPYVIRDAKVVPDLSSFAAGDLAVIRSIDREELRLAFLDRHRLDRQREEDQRQREIAAAKKREADETRARMAHRAAIMRLFDLFERERFVLAMENERRVVPAHILKRLGLTPQALAGDEWHRSLAEIAKRHDGEVAKIADYVKARPEHLKADGDHWRLDDVAPAEMRDLVTLWTQDPQIRAALGRAAAAAKTPEHPVGKMPPPDVNATAAALGLARPTRQGAVENPDNPKRLDNTGSVPPESEIKRSGSAIKHDQPRRPRGPWPPGFGFGD